MSYNKDAKYKHNPVKNHQNLMLTICNYHSSMLSANPYIGIPDKMSFQIEQLQLSSCSVATILFQVPMGQLKCLALAN